MIFWFFFNKNVNLLGCFDVSLKRIPVFVLRNVFFRRFSEQEWETY